MSVVKVKAAVRARDGYKCTDCGMTDRDHRAKYRRGLEVHRKVPGCAYSLEACVTVCKPCHWAHARSHPRQTAILSWDNWGKLFYIGMIHRERGLPFDLVEFVNRVIAKRVDKLFDKCLDLSEKS